MAEETTETKRILLGETWVMTIGSATRTQEIDPKTGRKYWKTVPQEVTSQRYEKGEEADVPMDIYRNLKREGKVKFTDVRGSSAPAPEAEESETADAGPFG